MTTSDTVSNPGFLKRIESLLELALARGAGALAFISAPRFWELVPAGGVDQALTTNAFVIVTGATTPATFLPTSTGRIRVDFNLAIAAGAVGDTAQVGVSVGAGSVVPVYQTAAPLTVVANDTVQVSGSVDLDQLSPAVTFPLGVPAVINVIVTAATANRLTVKGNGGFFRAQEIQ